MARERTEGEMTRLENNLRAALAAGANWRERAERHLAAFVEPN
jgi:hypothetical protein